MPHLIDAEPLIETFAETDPRMPLLVFSLLSVYLDRGPFEFDASAIADRLAGHKLEPRLNPEVIASLQPQLERFFEPTAQGWIPRPGVLAHERGGAAERSARSTRAPGDISPS
ncbi:MAG TPA: hypothetical protein VFO00_10670 [Vitreimonas sp.]|nr:hypothetical protein [Vitreimonas sp.]